MASAFAKLPEPPFYAVIFSSQHGSVREGYDAMAASMVELAAQQDGYLGHEIARNEGGFGITVSYWRDEDAIAAWKQNAKHARAQKLGAERWYEAYELRVAKVGRAYGGPAGRL